MDFNALQHKLFALDPTDPAEDLRKLAESAGSVPQENAPITESLVQESVEVQEGTMPVEGDYSLSDFAALAGVTLNESQVNELDAKAALKRGWDNHNTLGAIGIENPLKKLIDPKKSKPEKSDKKANTIKPSHAGNWKSFLQQHTAGLQKIAADPAKKKRFDTWMAKWNEDTNEQEIDEILPALGAMAGRAVVGAVANKAVDKLTASKKKKKKPIKSKIDPTTESIKEMLYRKLNSKK